MYKRCNFTYEVTGVGEGVSEENLQHLKFRNRNLSGLFNWKGINLSCVLGLAIWYKEALTWQHKLLLWLIPNIFL